MIMCSLALTGETVPGEAPPTRSGEVCASVSREWTPGGPKRKGPGTAGHAEACLGTAGDCCRARPGDTKMIVTKKETSRKLGGMIRGCGWLFTANCPGRALRSPTRRCAICCRRWVDEKGIYCMTMRGIPEYVPRRLPTRKAGGGQGSGDDAEQRQTPSKRGVWVHGTRPSTGRCCRDGKQE